MALEFRGIHQTILEDQTGEIDAEGSRMCGKTWLFSRKVQIACLKYPGIWWLINRYSGTETDNQLRPVFMDVCRRSGDPVPEWDGKESAYIFPEVGGVGSKVYAYGLKSQSRDERFAKVRGSGVAGLWNDQSEETPEDIGTEMRALIRQPGFPHQLLLSPNPPGEEHYLADQFPDDGNDLPGRKYYRLSLYDNRHNLSPDVIARLEAAYPPTHAKHKSLILGMRGPNITGTPVYKGAFDRATHYVQPIDTDRQAELYEAFDAGKHHPTWLVAQRTREGALQLLGGILGKRLFLEDFLPIVLKCRSEWFPGASIIPCCDPPPNDSAIRYTTLTLLRQAGLKPRTVVNGNAPDVRDSMIEYIGALMLRKQFAVSADPSRWLMVSHQGRKQTKLLIDGFEGSYVWSPNYVSVGNKTVRQPQFDEWLEGWQRCVENIALNFCAGKRTAAERASVKAAGRGEPDLEPWSTGRSPLDWAR